MPIFLETNVQTDQSCNMCQGKVKLPKKQVSASPMALGFSNHWQNIGLEQVCVGQKLHVCNCAQSVRLRRPGLGYFGKIEDQKSALKNGRWRPSKS